VEIAIAAQLHDDVQATVVQKRVEVADDVGVVQGGENLDLRHCGTLLLDRQGCQADLFQNVLSVVGFAPHTVDDTIAALPDDPSGRRKMF
jgi:hypothetical protein